MKTAVIYARYSSEMQKERSIEDQVALCRQIAQRQGYEVTHVYSDRAKSATSMFDRPGLFDMMQTAKKRQFNAVIVEAMHRLARDQEDAPAIWKRLRYSDVKIIAQDGEVTDLHVGVNAIVDSQFIKNLARSVTRGRNARVREGLIPGRVAYGYRKVPDKPGEREIDPEQAKIVVRMFEEYASGYSTRQICERLTAEGVRGPTAQQWVHQKLTSGQCGGLLANTLYIGKLRWNHMKQVKNPENGKRNNRKAPESDLIEVDVPHLRIVPQDLWDRVQKVRVSRRRGMPTDGGARVYRPHDKWRMLMGLLKCGACGGHMMIGQCNPADGSPRVVCSAAARRLSCANRKSYCVKTLQKIVLDGIARDLVNRKALVELTKSFHARWAEKQKVQRAERSDAKATLDRVTTQIDRIVTAISDSDVPIEVLMVKLKKLQREQANLTEKLRLIEADGNIVDLHPKMIDQFAASMEQLHTALADDPDTAEAEPFRAAFRNVFEAVVVHQTPKRMPYEVTPYVRVGAIMGFEMFPKMRQTEEVLAEQGVVVIGNLASTGTYTCQNHNSPALLGLGPWRQAA